MAKEVKIIWFRGYHPIYEPALSDRMPTYKDYDDTLDTEAKIAQYLEEGWTIASAGGGGSEKPRFFVILQRG